LVAENSSLLALLVKFCAPEQEVVNFLMTLPFSVIKKKTGQKLTLEVL